MLDKLVRCRAAVVACLIGLAVLQAASAASARLHSQQRTGVEKAVGPAEPSVVRITGADTSGGSIPDGAGFFVRKDLIATTYQVIRDGVSFKIQMGTEAPADARLVGVDRNRTVALMQADRSVGTALAVRYEHATLPGDDMYLLRRDGRPISCRQDGRWLKLEPGVEGRFGGSPIVNGWGEVIGLADITGRGGQGSLIPISALSDVGGILSAGSTSEVAARKAARDDVPAVEAAPETARPPELAPPPALAPPPESAPDEPPKLPQATVRVQALPGRTDSATEHTELLTAPSTIRKTGRALQQSIIRAAQPLYPRRAKAANTLGMVLVEVTIDQHGYVTAARAITGPAALRGPATAAAMAHLFAQSIVNNAPVEVIGTLTFNFKPQESFPGSGPTMVSHP